MKLTPSRAAAGLALLLTSQAAMIVRAEPSSVTRPDLTGRVLAKDGAPLAEATVFVFSAGPKIGRGILCPTCYPDCLKRATTDLAGQFRIESLDPQLIFRLLAVAKDRQPGFLPQVDPAKGPVEIALASRNERRIDPAKMLSGRVVDPENHPIYGAVVNFDFYWFGESDGCGGLCDGVDLLAVTDHEGQFQLTTERPFHSMSVTVEARGLAKRKFPKLPNGRPVTLQLTEGTTVTGRVMRDGAPVPNVTVGLLATDRSENGVGNFEITTDAKGRFLLSNIPAYTVYWIYGTLGSCRDFGCLPVKNLRVSGEGTTKHVGDLRIVNGQTVAGRVVLSDGKPIPPGTRLLLGRGDAWDTSVCDLDDTGRFEFRQIPKESVGLSVSVPGYRMSTRNKSLDLLNGGTLVGRVVGDCYVEILLEPGQFQPPDLRFGLQPGVDWQPRDKPLQGATQTTL
ncbi:MAG: carboxypeptidase-like regulatory domain-containing protein [Verrucomicrobiota bacterium]